MRLAGRVVAITGGGSGLGADACRLARARGEGHLAIVASSNALTSNPVSAAYATTKHAELALAEWLHFTYASRGITACCFCPKGC